MRSPRGLVTLDTGQQITVNPPTYEQRCPHARAEAVTLITGETVAAVCVTCLAKLPAAWLNCQNADGHQTATEVTALSSPVPELLCGRCHTIYTEPPKASTS